MCIAPERRAAPRALADAGAALRMAFERLYRIIGARTILQRSGVVRRVGQHKQLPVGRAD